MQIFVIFVMLFIVAWVVLKKKKSQKIELAEDLDDEDEDELDPEDELEEKIFELNQRGMQAEAAGDVEKAVRCYEEIVGNGFRLPHSYMRLAIIYKKQKRWEDVVRVCDAALDALSGMTGKLCQPEEYEKRRAEALSKISAP